MSTYVNPNPVPYYEGKKLVSSVNITLTVVGEQTINSPAAFYIYSTVKVITAAPVTDALGSFVCGTQGVVTNAWVTDADAFRTIDNENSNAQSYQGTSKIPEVKYPTTTFTSILTTTYLHYQSSFPATKTYTWEIESYSASHAPFPTAGSGAALLLIAF
ncbi:hypothetical protein HYFRA_00002053 [Hymenoscyphus fraxineus]|uniref:Uncharacterized protein n=1 Tax=Hymenoscyphus fraxineus TaxID=746836 RepID=A0A9N9KL33_9HELO|nr:hypothetical protein HYFRA_00002053 [Hymenoscyphus fraxineus]